MGNIEAYPQFLQIKHTDPNSGGVDISKKPEIRFFPPAFTIKQVIDTVS